ncbi:MAG TPA: hypothetical protein VM617_07550 [Thermoanaerobaculia bacterium]|nr:hypothetical protein [Thermoanaerobaculia bacterium]
MSRRPDGRWSLAAAAVAALAGVAVAQALPPPTELTFPRFNDVYEQPGAMSEPLEQGGMTIRLSSPENHLVLRSHRVRLAPLGDGTHWVEVVADFAGRGRVIAHLDFGNGQGTQLEDQVVLPPQTRTVIGRVVIAVGEGGDYEITPVELPETVAIAFESKLAGGLGDLCRTVARLGGMTIDCGSVEAGLTTAAIPLPEPGETYLLPAARLTADDRGRLDAYLARARDAG